MIGASSESIRSGRALLLASCKSGGEILNIALDSGDRRWRESVRYRQAHPRKRFRPQFGNLSKMHSVNSIPTRVRSKTSSPTPYMPSIFAQT